VAAGRAEELRCLVFVVGLSILVDGRRGDNFKG
jgi:hypothetical protein